MREHTLKTWPNAFDAVKSGAKRFEWRQDDRGFEVGDILVLRRFDPQWTWTQQGSDELHPTTMRVRVTYILRGQFGVPQNFCVMSIEPEVKR